MKINKKGFAAMKVITILAITSLWISISVPMLVHFSIESNQAQALNQMQKLTEACEKFKAQHGKYPNSINALADFFKSGGLTSPGYHYQYEFLNEGSFVLVGIPNNNFSGNGSFYSDDGLTVIEIPRGSGERSNPGILDGSAERSRRVKALIQEKQIKVSSLNLPRLPGIGKKAVVNNSIPDSTLVTREIENNNLTQINQENLVITKPERIPEVPIGGFEALVCALEGLSLPLPNSVAVASYDTTGLRIEKIGAQDFSSLGGNYHPDTSSTTVTASTTVYKPVPVPPKPEPKPKPEPIPGTETGRR